MLMTLRAMPTVAQLLGEPPLLDRLKGRCQTKSTPCQSRGGNPIIRPTLQSTCNVPRGHLVYCSPCGKGWAVT
jgi:hypothetical protein